MMDNRHLILGTTVSDADAVEIDTSNPQSVTTTPAEVVNLVTLDVILNVNGIATEMIQAVAVDDRTFILPANTSMVDYPVLSISHDTRLACKQWMPDDITGEIDRAMEMTSNCRTVDAYETIVDQFGKQQPGTHYLLKGGGNGYLTYENGSRILIL